MRKNVLIWRLRTLGEFAIDGVRSRAIWSRVHHLLSNVIIIVIQY